MSTTSRLVLPFDVQLEILDYLVTQERNEEHIRTSSYATVSKFWKSVVEQKLFRRLTLSSEDLLDFAAYSNDREHHIKHIVLELFVCTQNTSDSDERCFAKSIRLLFNTLTTWDSAGITLELGVLSAVETHGRCNKHDHVHLMKAKPRLRSPNKIFNHIRRILYTPGDIVIDGYSEEAGRTWKRHATRLLGHKPLEFPDSARPLLPDVGCISKFLIRRRYCPNIGSSSLTHIFNALKQLESVHIERWSYAGAYADILYQFGTFFFFNLPSSLKDFSFYIESDLPYHHRPRTTKSGFHNNLTTQLVRGMEAPENIAVSFAFDAKAFFNSTVVSKCSALKTLALTSEILVLQDDRCINDFLCLAAKSALQMPQLETLELWYYKTLYPLSPRIKTARVAIFTYQRFDQHRSCISWKSTRPFNMSEETQARWRDVCDVHDTELSVDHRVLKEHVTWNVGKLHEYLALKDRILQGRTWKQI